MSLVPPELPIKDLNIDLDELLFNRKVSKGRWLIKHYVKWCSHCQELAPVWLEIVKEFHEREDFQFNFGQVECDDVKNLCDAHGVSGYPTLQLFQDGKLEKEFDGFPTKDNIVKFIEEHKEPKPLEGPKLETKPESEFDRLQLANTNEAVADITPDTAADSPPQVPTQGVEMPPPEAALERDPSLLSIPDYVRNDIENAPSTTVNIDSPEENPHIDRTIPLTEANFTKAISHGIWVIRHTSKETPPPGRFHILWSQLTNDFSEFKKHLGFRFGTVDCDNDKNLCEKNRISTYPTIKLWEEGIFFENYEGELDYEPLAKYIRGIQSRKFDVTAFGSYQFPGSLPPNPDGTIDKLSSTSYSSVTSEGNWLVYYTSGTCASCRPLANTIEEVASKLKSKVNVAHFDCSNDIETCERHGVQGLPYITFIKDGIPKVYTGPRTEEKLIKFALSSSSPNFNIVNSTNWSNVRTNEDHYFLYAYSDMKEYIDFAKFKSVFDGLYLQSDIYMVDKKIATPTLDTQRVPNFFIQKPHVEPIAYDGLLTSTQELRKWLKENQYPALIPLGSENFDSILSEFNYMVLGILDPSKDHFNLEKMNMLSNGLSVNPTIKTKNVGFGWLDGSTHLDYVHTLGRNVEDLPFVVIIQPKENKIFSKLEDQSSLKFEKESVEKALDSLGEKKLKADQLTGSKSVFSSIKLLPSEGESFSSNHLVGLILVALALGFVYFLFKGRFRRIRKRQLN